MLGVPQATGAIDSSIAVLHPGVSASDYYNCKWRLRHQFQSEGADNFGGSC